MYVGSLVLSLPHLVARTTDMQRAVEAVFWFVVVLAAVGLGALVLMLVRRRVMREDRADPVGLDLQHLREMRDRGELTIPEYEALKQKIIEGYRAPRPK